jgi:hypothetical protein
MRAICLEAFFLEIHDEAQKSAEVAYISDHCTLIKYGVVDGFRENPDLQLIADTMTTEVRIRRDGVTDESRPSIE